MFVFSIIQHNKTEIEITILLFMMRFLKARPRQNLDSLGTWEPLDFIEALPEKVHYMSYFETLVHACELGYKKWDKEKLEKTFPNLL